MTNDIMKPKDKKLRGQKERRLRNIYCLNEVHKKIPTDVDRFRRD